MRQGFQLVSNDGYPGEKMPISQVAPLTDDPLLDAYSQAVTHAVK